MIQKNRTVKLITYLSAIFILAGCAASRGNLVQTGAVNLEKVSDAKDNAYVIFAYAHQEGNDLVVTGEVKRRSRLRNFSGHTDITILSPAGELIKEVSVDYYPKRIPRKGQLTSRFSVHFPMETPENITVRVRYHDDPHQRG